MLKIPRKQVLARWDSLTDNLREALCSEQNANILWRVCENQHISKDKIYTVATLAGDAIMGFIHPEDLAKEIKTELNIAPEIANTISDEIDRKIFTPVRMDLEKVYAPPAEEEILDLRAKYKEVQLVEVPAAPEFIITEEKPKTEIPLKPIEIKETAVEAPKIIPTEEKKEITEILLKPIEIKETTVEAGPAVASEAGPMIIHKEGELKPLSETKKSLGGLFGFLRKGKEEVKPTPVKTELEIGLDKRPSAAVVEPTKIEPLAAKSEPPKARVVHYAELRTPISPFPKPEEERKEELPLAEAKPMVSPVEPPENLPVVAGVKPPVVSRVEPHITTEAVPPIKKEIPIPSQPPRPPMPPFSPQPPIEKFVQKKIEPIIKPQFPKVETPPKIENPLESILNLQKTPEPIKPMPEKPISPIPPAPASATPTKPETKPEEEIIDLGTFK